MTVFAVFGVSALYLLFRPSFSAAWVLTALTWSLFAVAILAQPSIPPSRPIDQVAFFTVLGVVPLALNFGAVAVRRALAHPPAQRQG